MRRFPLWAAALVTLVAASSSAAGLESEPLWPGAAHTQAQRDRAVLKGLDFIFGTARSPKSFEDYASDYLWCFYTVAEGSTDPATRQRAWKYGRELAQRWRKENLKVPPDADADEVSELTTGLEVSERFGVRNDTLRAELERAVRTFTAEDFLDFDPRQGPPPSKTIVLEGDEACAAAGRAPRDAGGGPPCPPVERLIPDYDTWYDALITVYFGDRFGVPHGATFEDLMRLRPGLLPYPDRAALGEDAYYDLVYLVTHLVYTHGDYNLRRVSPTALPGEYDYIRRNFAVVVADEDGETYAEFVDTLKAFGRTPESDVEMAAAIERLLSSQNPDGSWGDVHEKGVYHRYHTTWTAVSALIDYRFAGEVR